MTLLILSSDWFISHYAQTTPMNNKAISDQPLLNLRQAQESFIPLVKWQQRLRPTHKVT